LIGCKFWLIEMPLNDYELHLHTPTSSSEATILPFLIGRSKLADANAAK
jgi:hypothetical protein